MSQEKQAPPDTEGRSPRCQTEKEDKEVNFVCLFEAISAHNYGSVSFQKVKLAACRRTRTQEEPGTKRSTEHHGCTQSVFAKVMQRFRTISSHDFL